MKLKDLTTFGKSIFQKGKEILNSRSTVHHVPEDTELKTPDKPVDLGVSPVNEQLVKKFEIPTADNPVESSRQQSMLDSQGLANKTDYHAQGRIESSNSNRGQRNYDNHQQN